MLLLLLCSHYDRTQTMSHRATFYPISHDLSVQVFKYNVFFILSVDKKLLNVRKNYDLIDHLYKVLFELTVPT